MITLFITALVLIALIALGIMAFIGIFNKKISIRVNLIIGFIRTLKISWINIKRLPSRFRLLIKILPYKSKLLFLKINKRLQIKRQERRKIRRDRRRHQLNKFKRALSRLKKTNVIN